ncbi:hypothetical protein ACFX1Q_017417 [Malus domestica]
MVICYFGHLCFLSDIIFSISRNYELVIPFGLFVGCFLTDVLEEALQQLLPSSEENATNGIEKYLFGISYFLAAVKFVSAGLPMQARGFLLHVVVVERFVQQKQMKMMSIIAILHWSWT